MTSVMAPFSVSSSAGLRATAGTADHRASISASWASWMRCTLSERTTRQWSTASLTRHGPALVAAKPTVSSPRREASSKARSMLTRVAAGGEPDGDVAGPGVGDELAGEDELEADVVGQRGEHGPVVDQGQGRQRVGRPGGPEQGRPRPRRRWRCRRCRRRRAGRRRRSARPWPSPARSSSAPAALERGRAQGPALRHLGRGRARPGRPAGRERRAPRPR